MNTVNTNKLISKVFLGAMSGALLASTAWAASPVGELEVQGSANVARGADASARISDTTYGWFSGDRVETHAGTAVLSLDNGASLGFAEQSAGSVSVEAGVVTVSLDSGTLLYALDDQTSELVVESGDYHFSTQASQARAIEVSREWRGAAGMIQVGDAGQVEVSVRAGVLSSRNASGSMQYQVVSGESVAFDGADVRQVEVQLGNSNRRGGEEEGSFFCPGEDTELCWVGLGGAAITIGAIANQAASDDDRQPTSP